MESTTLNTSRLVWLIAITGVCITLVAFQKLQKPKSPAPPKIAIADTIPKKKELKIRNLDEALEDLDDIEIKVDVEKVNAELAKIKPEVEKAVAQAKVEIDKAVKEIDIAAIGEEVNAALAKVDCEKINKEVKAAIDEVDWDAIKKEIEEVKQVDIEKVNVELKKIKPELEKNLANAKVEIQKAKKELLEYKDFVDGLSNDGLVNKKEEYTIKHRNGELIINGKVQPKAVYNKYRSFLEKHKTLTIEKSDDDFNIDND